MANGTLPVENEAQERAVLGALIGNIDLYWQIKDALQAEMFVKPLHQKIVNILHVFAVERPSFSIASIVGQLPTSEDFNVDAYLATIVMADANPANIGQDMEDIREMWSRRRMLALAEFMIRTAREDNGKSSTERLEAAVASVGRIGDSLGSGVRHIWEAGQRVLDRVDDARFAERPLGMDLGLATAQKIMGPLYRKRLYIVGGPPGSGKTTLAQQVGMHVAQNDVVLMISLEMSDEELATREISYLSGVEGNVIERATPNESQMEDLIMAHDRTKPLSFYTDTTKAQTIQRIRASAMRTKRLQKGLALVIIDHAFHIRRPEKTGELEGFRIILQEAKNMAGDLDCAVMLLTQYKGEYGSGPWSLRRPNNGDLLYNGLVEAEADVIMHVHRPEYLLSRKEPDKANGKDHGAWAEAMERSRGRAELILGKRRGGQPYGNEVCFFDGKGPRFYDKPPRGAIVALGSLDDQGRFL